MNTPVAFLVFNRPDCTARVFAQIRRARPARLLVIADGPRPGRDGEAENCAAVRRIIDDGVDWPCQVERNYAETNLGCARRVAGGLDWAFSRAERLIVLEDDCLPDDSFFPFCEELLERYAEDDRVGQICGCPRYFSRVKRAESYLFSRYGPIWGWASWRRAWRYYDLEMKSWPSVKQQGSLRAVLQSDAEYARRVELYDQLHGGPPSTWDYQWGYAKLANGLLCAMSTVNLVENIGFDERATHLGAGKFELARGQVAFPLCHPVDVVADRAFDQAYAQAFLGSPRGIRSRLRGLASRFFKRLFHATS